MATNVLLVGTAAAGESNTVTRIESLSQLYKLFGGDYAQTLSLTSTATSAVLDYVPQSVVKNSQDLKTGVLYGPSVNNTNYYFGSVGGTGATVTLTYTPYLGTSDLLNTASFLLENDTNNFYVCRIGGTPATLATNGWTLTSNLRGIQNNRISLSSTASSISMSAYGQWPARTYSGQVEDIVSAINLDSQIGVCPFYISDYTTTIPSFNQSLTGGLDGVVDYTSINQFLDNVDVPADVSHIIVLGNISDDIAQLISDYHDSGEQFRVWCFQAPSLDGSVNYLGTAYSTATTFYTKNPTPIANTFEGYAHNTLVQTLQSINFSPTGMAIVNNLQGGYTNVRTYSGTGSLQLFPDNVAKNITLTPISTGLKLSSMGFWIGKGTDRLRISAYDNQNNLLYSVDSLSGVPSGTPHFMGIRFNTPLSKVVITPLSYTTANTVSIDNLSFNTVQSGGTSNNIDQVLSYIRNFRVRHPMISVFGGQVNIQVRGTTYQTNAVNAVSLTILNSGGLLTNKTAKVLGLLPIYSEPELELAQLNGINLYRRWIGSGVAIDIGVCSYTDNTYNYSSKVAEISATAGTYLRQFLGYNMKEGYQKVIQDELKNRLGLIRDVSIDTVLIDYIDGVLRVFIEGLIYKEILKISFSVSIS